jgi:hypothetical protein
MLKSDIAMFIAGLVLLASSPLLNSATQGGLAALNGESMRQASIIAYADDFKRMPIISVPTALLLILIRRVAATGGPAPLPQK